MTFIGSVPGEYQLPEITRFYLTHTSSTLKTFLPVNVQISKETVHQHRVSMVLATDVSTERSAVIQPNSTSSIDGRPRDKLPEFPAAKVFSD